MKNEWSDFSQYSEPQNDSGFSDFSKYSEKENTASENLAERGDFNRGLRSGIRNTAGLLGAAGGLAADAVGLDSLAQKGYDFYTEQNKLAELNPGLKVEDIHGFGDAVDWLQYNVGQQIPTLISMALSGGIGAAAGKKILGGAAKKAVEKQIEKGVKRSVAEKIVANKIASASAKVGVAAGSGALEGGGMWGTDVERHGIEGTSPFMDIAAGAISGASETLSPTGRLAALAAGAKKIGGEKAAKSLIKRLGVSIPKNMLEEGAQEGFQQFVSDLNRKLQNPNLPFVEKDTLSQYLNSIAAGAAIGGLAGPVTAITDNAGPSYEKQPFNNLGPTYGPGLSGSQAVTKPKIVPETPDVARAQLEKEINDSIKKLDAQIGGIESRIKEGINIYPDGTVTGTRKAPNQRKGSPSSPPLPTAGKVPSTEIYPDGTVTYDGNPLDQLGKPVFDLTKADNQRRDYGMLNDMADNQVSIQQQDDLRRLRNQRKALPAGQGFELVDQRNIDRDTGMLNDIVDNQASLQQQEDIRRLRNQRKALPAGHGFELVTPEDVRQRSDLSPADKKASADLREFNKKNLGPPKPKIKTRKKVEKATGIRVKISGMGPQTYDVVRVEPRDSADLPGEKFYLLRNERTGEEQVIDNESIVPLNLHRKRFEAISEKTVPEKLAEAIGKPHSAKNAALTGQTEEEQIGGIVDDAVKQPLDIATQLEAKGKTDLADKYKKQAHSNGAKLKAADGITTEKKVDEVLSGNAENAQNNDNIHDKVNVKPETLNNTGEGLESEKTENNNEATGENDRNLNGLRPEVFLSPGETAVTATGRDTTPFPKVDISTPRKALNTVKRIDNWLVDNAIDEARARNDDFNLIQFKDINRKNVTQSDKDSANDYLFGGYKPKILPTITKPLSPDSSTTNNTQDASVASAPSGVTKGEGKGFNPLDLLTSKEKVEPAKIKEPVASKIIIHVEKAIDSLKVEAEKWRNKKYKTNRKVVAVGGTNDDLNSGRTTIGAANDRRRATRIADTEKAISELETFKEKISTSDNGLIGSVASDKRVSELAGYLLDSPFKVVREIGNRYYKTTKEATNNTQHVVTKDSPGVTAAKELAKEYKENSAKFSSSKVALGRFKAKVRRVAKTIPESDEKAVMLIDMLSTRAGMNEDPVKSKTVKFASEKPVKSEGDSIGVKKDTSPKFSKSAPDKPLSAIHSLTEENLIYADKQGGLPVPSIAVVKGDMGMNGYGSITLIGTKDLADPNAVPVYDSDAYTSTFPVPEYKKIRYSQAEKIIKRLEGYSKYSESISSLLHQIVEFGRYGNFERTLNLILNSNVGKAAFLGEIHGRSNIRVNKRQVPLGHDGDIATLPRVRAFFKNNKGVNLREDKDKLVELSQIVRDDYLQKYEGRESVRARLIDSVLSDDGLLPFATYISISNAQHKIGKKTVDKFALREKLDRMLKGKEAEYKKWVESIIGEVYGEPFLTISGKRVPYTLDNIARKMIAKGKASEKTLVHGAGKTRATMAKRFRTLKKMRADAYENIKTKAEIEEGRKIAESSQEKYRDNVIKYYKYSDTWAALDDSMKALSMAAKMGGGRESLKSALMSLDFKADAIPEYMLYYGIDAMRATINAPVPYFEAKPQRVVSLSEFAGAVIPKNTPKNIKEILKRNGIKYRIYGDRLDENARAEAVNKLRRMLYNKGERTLFSSGSGHGGKASDLKSFINKILPRGGANNLSVEVVQSDKEFSDKLGTIYAKDGKTVEGAYDPKTGKIYLVADNVTTDRAWSILLHEAVHKVKAEKGWSGVFGKRSQAVMRSIDARIKAGDKAWKLAEQKAKDAGAPESDLREETITYFLASKAGQKTTLWKRIANAVRKFLVDSGIRRKISDADIQALAEDAVIRRAGTEIVNAPKTTKDGIRINYVGKEQLGDAFGFFDGENIFVRNDLPLAIMRFVAEHEGYHAQDFSSSHWITKEIKASLFPGIKDPAGLVKTIIASLSPDRMRFYRSRLRNKGTFGDDVKYSVSNPVMERDGVDSFITRALGSERAKILTHMWIDQHAPAKVVQNRYGKMPEKLDYLAAERARGKKATAEIGKFNREEVQPLLKRLAKDNLTIADLEDYSLAMHTKERNARMRRVNALAELRNIKRTKTGKELEELQYEIDNAKAEIFTKNRQNAYLDLMQAEFDKIPEIESGIEADKIALENREWTDKEIDNGTPERLKKRIENREKRLNQLKKIKKSWDYRSIRFAGQTDDDAKVVLNEWRNSDKYQQIEDAQKRLAKINLGRLDNLLEAGELSREEYDAIKGTYKYYVPLYREGFADGRPPVGSSTLGPTGKPIKVATGSSRKVIDIFANSIANRQAAITRKHKAETKKILHDLINYTADFEKWSVDDIPTEKGYDSEGNVIDVVSMQEPENGIFIKINGKRKLLNFDEHDKDMMRMVRTIKQSDLTMGPIVKTLAKVTRILASLNTTFSPEFMITNFSRDIQTAGINMADSEAKGMQMKVMKGIPKMMRQIFNAEMGKKDSAIYRDFEKHGAKIGWMQSYDTVADLAKTLSEDMKLYQEGHLTKKTLAKAKTLIESANTAVENAVRLSTYNELVKSGVSKNKAAAVASNLTVDFTRHGTAGPNLNALYVFSNAGIQGNIRMLRAMKNKKVQKMAGGIIASGFAMHMLALGMGGNDDDGIPYYDKLDDSLKNRNMIFMLPGTKGKYFRIPTPYGYGLLWNIGDEMAKAAVAATSGERYSAVKGAGRIMTSFGDTFNPIASGTLLQTVMPTIGDPFAMAAENSTWFGGPLMPEKNPYGRPKPDSYRYWKSVNPTTKAIAQAVNSLTGGSSVKPGAIDISPETLDMIVDTYTGSAGKFVKDVIGLPFKIGSGNVEIKDIPFARKFVGSKSPWADSKLYRQRKDDILVLEDEMKVAKTVNERRKIRRNPDYRYVRLAREYEKKLRRLYRLKKTTNSKAIDLQINKIQKQFLRLTQ